MRAHAMAHVTPNFNFPSDAGTDVISNAAPVCGANTAADFRAVALAHVGADGAADAAAHGAADDISGADASADAQSDARSELEPVANGVTDAAAFGDPDGVAVVGSDDLSSANASADARVRNARPVL